MQALERNEAGKPLHDESREAMAPQRCFRIAVTGLTLGLCGSVTTFGQSNERFIRQPKSSTSTQPLGEDLPIVATESTPASSLQLDLTPPVAPPEEPREANKVAGGQSAVNLPSLETDRPLRFAPLIRNPVNDNSASTSTASQPLANQNVNSLQWVSRSSPLPASSATVVTRTQSSLPVVAPRSQEYRIVPAPDPAQLARYQAMEARLKEVEAKLQEKVEAEKTPTKAMLASSRILNDPKFSQQLSLQSTPGRVETPQGWQSIGQRLSGHITNSESLLRRGAFFSARQEAENAIGMLIRHIDLLDNQFRCEPAWRQAQQALREAEDFSRNQQALGDENGLHRLIAAHETEVLKGASLKDLSPLTAAQHYRAYAEKQLVEASQLHPWASELYYVVGRTYQAEADQDTNRVDSLRANALTFYRAARQILPTNAVACNQLGYLLLQLDRPEEAREALVAAVQLKSDEAYLSNLAEASRRLGDRAMQDWATNTVAVIRANRPRQPIVPSVIEIAPEEFKALSPMGIGPKVPQMQTNANPQTNIAMNPSIGNAPTPQATDRQTTTIRPQAINTAAAPNMSAGRLR